MGNVMNTQQTYRCPCTSGLVFDDCCRPILTGHKRAVTAESLVRTRFCAHVVRDYDYLLQTWHPVTRPVTLDLPARRFWYWLDIDAVIDGGPHDDTGSVAYTAYRRDSREHASISELAHLERYHGWWVYRSGEVMDD
ncbi:YchJ family metal-binding protein [Gordonia sp. N1V]|uniref:YchJ family protein n=1 Tax=Gordonia sp. N1V TaxID=3034163 RepID=UPI0023E2820E|nr:YchJ family metal-binding protein [Gordonia sp. N1V]MDF3281116.1 YchJ family metal-binding protein [Gordonia sp. N1V]